MLTGQHTRAVKGLGRRLGVAKGAVVDDLSGVVGNTGTAHAALVLASALDTAASGEIVAVVGLADGADVLVFRTTDALAVPHAGADGGHAPQHSTPAATPGPTASTCAWRGAPQVEPPRRPEPDRPSGSAAGRTRDWKFGFVGARDRESRLAAPPAGPCFDEGRQRRRHGADTHGRRAGHGRHLHRRPRSPTRPALRSSPPSSTSTAVVASRASSPTSMPPRWRIGDRVEMTFRRLFTSDGIHNYFWKARAACATCATRPTPSEELNAWHHTASRTRWPSSGWACTRFGEHWDRAPTTSLLDAVERGASRRPEIDQGRRRRLLARHRASRACSGHHPRPGRSSSNDKPVTRVENFCATGSEALRAAPATPWRRGAYDMAMAVGVEKVKDSGYQGLNAMPIPDTTAPSARSPPRPCTASSPRPTPRSTGSTRTSCKDVLARDRRRRTTPTALRTHVAQFRSEIVRDAICAMPRASPVSCRCSTAPASPTARPAAIVVRAEDAHRYTDRPLYVKALSFVAGNGAGNLDPDYDYTTFPEVSAAAKDAYAQAGITDPRRELAMAEVHDCFTPTELVLMEDLGFAERGMGWKEVLAGTFDLDGDLPVNPDGGLKSFGHPIGASGLRMLFECWLQLRHEAPHDRQIDNGGPELGLVHNLGGYPGEMVSFVAVVGPEPG
ncbi:MAG: hypothetical protein U5R31_09365 [Acidimicrobiia bacterium]|nr:hypothetical protein [Acidimicrobiia bacterium]